MPDPSAGQAETVASPRKQVSLGGATLWFAVPYGFALLSYFAINAIAARWLGVDGFGRFAAVITVTTLFGQLGLLGIHRAGLRAAARLRDGDDPAELAEQLRTVRAVTRLSLPGTGLVSAIGAWVLLSGDGQASWLAPVAVGLLVVVSGQQRLWANYLRGFGNVRVAGLLEGRSGGSLVGVAQVALLGTLFVLTPDLRLGGALAAMAMGYVLPLLAIRGFVARPWRGVRVRWRPLSDLALAWRRGARFAVIQAGSYLNTNLDLWIGVWLLSTAHGSQFAAALRLVLLLIIPLTSLQIVFSPVISRMWHRGELAALERLLRTAATLITGLLAVLLLPMIVLPGPLLEFVFGPAFGPAGLALAILSIGMAVQVLGGMCAPALTMSDAEGLVARVHTIGIVARVGFGAVGASLGGIVGLSVSSAIVTAATAVCLWWLARRRLGISTHPTARPQPRLLLRTPG